MQGQARLGLAPSLPLALAPLHTYPGILGTCQGGGQ